VAEATIVVTAPDINGAEVANEAVDADTEDTIDTPDVLESDLFVCGSVAEISGAGFPGVSFKEVAQQRVLYRSGPPVPTVVGTSSSSTVLIPTEEVVLTLPLRLLPVANPSCIGSDVVGVATDGSFIRNDELSLYSIFDSGTLIGYALDGFPIYGTTDQLTDRCGGAVVEGTYRYFVSPERETILSCFSGVPLKL
jgi:hypothetical protein